MHDPTNAGETGPFPIDGASDPADREVIACLSADTARLRAELPASSLDRIAAVASATVRRAGSIPTTPARDGPLSRLLRTPALAWSGIAATAAVGVTLLVLLAANRPSDDGGSIVLAADVVSVDDIAAAERLLDSLDAPMGIASAADFVLTTGSEADAGAEPDWSWSDIRSTIDGIAIDGEASS